MFVPFLPVKVFMVLAAPMAQWPQRKDLVGRIVLSIIRKYTIVGRHRTSWLTRIALTVSSTTYCGVRIGIKLRLIPANMPVLM